MPVGPLRLQTINQQAVDTEAQTQGAPAFSKLRRALLQTSTMAANEDNPAKKREMLRAAMEGTGTGMSDISLASHNQALSTIGKETDVANQGIMAQFGADTEAERQQIGIASQEKMQGLSLAEARAAQERGISAEQALQEKQLAATKENQLTGIASQEKMQGLSLAEARDAQARGITAAQALQEKQISSTEKMQGLSLAEARSAQERGISAAQALQDKELAASKWSVEYGAANAQKMQQVGIDSAEKMQKMSLDQAKELKLLDFSEARWSQERGISAAETMQAKELASSWDKLKFSTDSQEKMQQTALDAALKARLEGTVNDNQQRELDRAAAKMAQERGISAAQAMKQMDYAAQFAGANYKSKRTASDVTNWEQQYNDLMKKFNGGT